MARFKVKGAKKLEDIEIIDGNIYLTDSASGAVLKITDFFDKEKREVTRVSKLPSPKGMIYDEDKDALLIVSATENKLYELNLEDIKKSTSYQIGPKETRTSNGFYDLCMGNQKEIYLVHYSYGRILVYFRDEDRPKTISQPMKMAKPFINDLRSPTSIIYDSSLNRIIYTEYISNKVRFQKGLKPQLTMDQIKEKIDIKID
ncbi:MAG: hypothetical protein NE330_09865 [Lentisphaeraceae bacterium]|nr:hypothetical protein [Lentisphaeraceae bacterium]